MVSGIGVDIVEIARIESMLERFGERIARRLLTRQELETFHTRHNSASFLASRFAAKEAASKALGTGIRDGIGFHSIEVVRDEVGKPVLHFHGEARKQLDQRGIHRHHLSLSDERHYAVAMVVLEVD